MYKKILPLLILILSLAVTVEAAKKVVAIQPLENVSGYAEYRVAEIMTENIIEVIHSSGNYTVSERVQMGRVLKEQGFQNLTSNNPVEMGNMTSADYSVVGKVTMATITNNVTGNIIGNIIGKFDKNLAKYSDQLKAKVAMDVRFIDNKTGEVIFVKSFEGSQSGQNKEVALNGACRAAAENFLREIQNLNPFSGRIAEISGSDVYIDVGSESGIRKGETLIVARESSPIIIHGEVVGMKSTTVGKVRVVEVNARYSICKIEAGASGIKKGDIVKR